MNNYGWKGSFKEFIQTDKDEIVNKLCLQNYEQTLEEARHHPWEESTLPQIKSWYDCINYLMLEVLHFQHLPGFLIFEFEILRSGRRRPDVLLFLPGEMVVLEFKRYSNVGEAEYTQISHYVRDIQSYHSTVQDFALNVRGGLVLTSERETLKGLPNYRIYQLGKSGLRNLVKKLETQLKDTELISVDDFLNGEYQPLPSIIESARAIMRDEPLPQIKTLKSSNYDHVMGEIHSIVETAKQNQTHHLILVSGVPGAGKTFVGLMLAHQVEKAVYLSGNRPLVDVLQNILGNTTFVQSLYSYKTDYLRNGKIPSEHVMIFDEAQRAWDAKQMQSHQSEPDVIIEIAKHKQWSVVVALIGEGQEIHIGEEAGIDLWNKAIKNQGFHVHARNHQTIFPYALKYNEKQDLHLSTSLRTHNALTYFEWVEAIIEGDFRHANELQKKLIEDRYLVKFVSDLEEAKEYVRKSYEDTDKTYGMVISSGLKYPKGVKVLPYQKHVEFFNDQTSPYYCKNLKYAATEFQVQGLELDMAIVYWGEDLQWKDNTWEIDYPKKGAKDPYQMKLNAYRVLLTRGRDGVIICQR